MDTYHLQTSGKIGNVGDHELHPVCIYDKRSTNYQFFFFSQEKPAAQERIQTH